LNKVTVRRDALRWKSGHCGRLEVRRLLSDKFLANVVTRDILAAGVSIAWGWLALASGRTNVFTMKDGGLEYASRLLI
jgi:hypothetical protein